MQYGYFDDHAREYVITNPRTPVKWINYVGTLAFGGFVDHTGGSLICRGDPALNRIVKYIPQLPAAQFNGETLYVRIKQAAGYRVFSPYFVPTLDPYDRYECHIGLGYVRIVSTFYGVATDVTIFVPPGANRVLRDIRIRNDSAASLVLDAIPVVEYTHPDALKQLTNADWVPQTMQSRVVAETGGLWTLLQYPYMFRESCVNYFTSNLPASSFETDRRRFLGDNEYGTWAGPLALQQPELSNTQAPRGDNIAALLHPLGALVPGESRRLITQLGQAESFAAAGVDVYRNPADVDRAWYALGSFWDEYLAKLQVTLPDGDMQRMLNIHNPHQCHTTMNWSRDLSRYQLGFGARGIGVRDTAQDIMGIMAQAPESARALVDKLMRVHKRDGAAMHQFNPLTLLATSGDARERPDLAQFYCDDHLWLILAVTAYLKETGDFSLLEASVPYYDDGQAGSIYEHLARAIEFTHVNVGAHGLPLLGYADWNDTVNLRSGAESLFAANLYGKALLEMVDLAAWRHDSDSLRIYLAYYQEMKERFNACTWDGAWFLRYFDADGTPLGSARNAHGQIYVNGQSWPVISGFADRAQGRAALDAVYRHLNTRNGIKLSTPGFDGYDRTRGGITTYPPGAKENGGIFLHANPWVIIAECLLRNGDRAYEYYAEINPAAKNERIDEFECEPYVYPQNILGDEHPLFGLARNSWLSGTASWAYQAATQSILGLRPTYGGLELDPCIPHTWPGFQVRRAFRGAVYDIEVSNPGQVCSGIAAIELDGRKLAGQCLPELRDGKVHSVRAEMGSSAGGAGQ